MSRFIKIYQYFFVRVCIDNFLKRFEADRGPHRRFGALIRLTTNIFPLKGIKTQISIMFFIYLIGSSHRLSGDSGIIAHPGYPTNYENGVYSTWLINADPSNKIRLYFDTFSLQSSSGCSKDYVEVYDGDKTTDRRIGKYCSTNPGWIVSTGSQMLVVFRTNSEVTNSGFYARWNTEKRTRSDSKC